MGWGLAFPFALHLCLQWLKTRSQNSLLATSSRSTPPRLKASVFLSLLHVSFILQASQGEETMIHNDSCFLVVFLL